MSQEIKIGVNANTTSAEAAVKGIEAAADNAAKAVKDVGSALDKMGRTTRGAQILEEFRAGEAAAKKMADSVRRVRDEKNKLSQDTIDATRRALSGMLGKPVSEDDARTAAENFRRARKVSSSARAFDDLEQWNNGVDRVYRDPARAAEHRRRVLASVLQRTGFSGPPPGGGGGGDEEPGAGGGGGSPGLKRGMGTALGFGKSMLALAGITSIMGMASQGVDLASEEATGTDTLKRRMGDLGVDFDRLRDQARGAGQGLGVTFVEANRLAQQFAKEAGNLRAGDLDGQGLQRSLRTGIGLSRAFGLDPSAGNQFFGTMHRLGVATDDQSNRKLGLTIADAIAKGGYGGKADEVLAAIADYSTQVSRITLAAPNVTAYAGAMASLTGTGYAGLDPAGAAAILGSADSAVRRGGAYGQASMNFSYAALYKGLPGVDPVTAQGLLAGGMFGSTRNQFGGGTALGDFYRQNNIATPALSDTTNFERMMPMLRKQYGNTPWLLDAMKNHFGLQSIQQAAALAQMQPDSLHNMVGMVNHAGLKLSDLKDTSYAGLAAIANAKTPADLDSIYRSTRQRKDISASEREALDKAATGGNQEALRDSLVKVVGTHEQVETEGTKTRDSIADLKSELTRVGGALLDPLNMIRTGIVAMAEHFAPGTFKDPVLTPSGIGADLVKGYRESDLKRIKGLVDNNHSYDRYFQEAGKKYGIPWQDIKLRGAMESDLLQRPGPMTKYGQAYGIMQVMPSKKHPLSELQDIKSNIFAGAEHMADDLRRAKGNRVAAAGLYYAGSPKNWGPNTQQYMANFGAASEYALGKWGTPLAGTPLPDGDPGAKSANGAGVNVNVKVTADPLKIHDDKGNERHSVVLKASAAPTPAGAS